MSFVILVILGVSLAGIQNNHRSCAALLLDLDPFWTQSQFFLNFTFSATVHLFLYVFFYASVAMVL